ncbi:MAG TPA: glycosyltransferase family 2 protein, partial [Longimicrobiales bacterium]|nr:glycosyltransferase family 2 protein [Longimicrobiales bacterium]
SRDPDVSVLLPVRNGATHLPEAIASLEAQTLENFEVVAVDDGSTDRTAEILGAWAVRDSRVRVLHQAAAGIVAALERARSAARAPYLARMDADDVCDRSRLAEQRALMEREPALVACGCGVAYFPQESVRDGARRYEEWMNASVTPDQIARDIFVECPLAHPSFFIRASALERVGGYRDQDWPEDYDLVLRLWASGGRFGKVPQLLLRWREGPERLSRTDPRYAAGAFLACKVHHLRRTLLVGRAGVVVWGGGPVGKAAARALLGAGTRVIAFVDVDPRKVGQVIHGAPVLAVGEGVGIEGALHLAAVGQPGARERLRRMLGEAGLEELRDFVAIA